ncbi:MAG TPA: DUF3300 domain-containing protein [Geomonas sp.]
MKKIIFALPAVVIFLVLGAGQQTARAESQPGYYMVTDQSDPNLLSQEELLDLLAPIALYPDPLIAQILPAATFVDQIDEAARYVRQYGKSARLDDQPWDVSVRAVAHYPDVLFMMDQKYDWTAALGQAFVDQPQDVMDAIQDLRAEAREQGNLVSTREQQVIIEPDYIRIVPAAPEYIYVPVYDPQVIYQEPQPSYGFITFGAGFAIGAWLSRDLDWQRHRVYDHGWRGDGWVSRSRPHIRDRRGIYINNRATVINTNNRVLQRDTTRFRQQLRRDVERRREQPGRPARPPRVDQPRPGRIDQPRQPRSEQQRPATTGQQAPAATGRQRQPETGQRPAPTGQPRPSATGQQRPAPTGQQPQPATGQQRPGARDVFRGRDVQKEQPASRSGYGGYGSSKDAKTYRERGQTSRENMRQINRPAPVQPPAVTAPRPSVVAPAPRPSVVAPAPRPSVAPAPRQVVPHAPRPVIPRTAPQSVAPIAQPGVQPVPRPAAPEGRGRRE